VHTRLAGICGSDLSLVEGHASTYFEDWVSFPFVPGHEVVGELDDGTRVVLEPVLGHAARGFVPPFPGAAPGDGDDYAHLATTGPARTRHPDRLLLLDRWRMGAVVRAHESQLHRIADDVPDERAVLSSRSPAASTPRCSPGPRRRNGEGPGRRRARRRHDGARRDRRPASATCPACTSSSGARYPPPAGSPRRSAPTSSCSPTSCPGGAPRGRLPRDRRPPQLGRARHDRRGRHQRVDHRLPPHHPPPRPGRAARHAADVKLDLTGLWHRETELKGAYTYGTETLADGTRARTFDLAVDTANHYRAERLLSATYRLADHVDAIAHAAAAGRRGAVKIAFDLAAR
jgi:hypothetical protein